MDTMRTIRTFFARLAGAPMPAERTGGGRRGRRREPSGLYEPSAETDRRTSRQRDGDEGEDFARRYLERAGLTYVAGKVAYRDGELDLVMREGTRDPGGGAPHGSMLVFVEVRRRAGAGHGGAAASVTREKRRRIVAAASHFLVGLGLRTLPRCRFDVLSIDGDLQHGFRVEWIRDAFIDEGRG